jgi:hypothetical protein
MRCAKAGNAYVRRCLQKRLNNSLFAIALTPLYEADIIRLAMIHHWGWIPAEGFIVDILNLRWKACPLQTNT